MTALGRGPMLQRSHRHTPRPIDATRAELIAELALIEQCSRNEASQGFVRWAFQSVADSFLRELAVDEQMRQRAQVLLEHLFGNAAGPSPDQFLATATMRQLARDVMDACHPPSGDHWTTAENVQRMFVRARTLAEFILGEET